MVTVALPFPCPAPGAPVEWDRIEYPWIAPMAACAQDPGWHGEGDVWTHTRMVCDALVALPEWQALPEAERETVFGAALLHDVAKPVCTRFEDGRIRHPNHSLRGAIMARRILWKMDAPWTLREQVAGLIRFHQSPFFLLDDADPLRKAARISYVARCDHLALLARADALGRIADDVPRILENIALFEEYCREQGCLDGPLPFPSDHSRFEYFRTPGRSAAYEAYDDTRCEAVLMSGLPGSGKSHWLREHPDLPVVTLDDIRTRLKVKPTEPQGPVLDAARELARGYLRQRQSFAWNATNVSRELRGRLIDLFATYRARVRIVYVEASRERLLQQNRQREAAVPEAALERMLDHWDVPDLTEAHRVEYLVSS